MAASARNPRISARRAEVLDGLVELFLAEGFLAFSVEDWTGRLQCSKSTLYAVAPSKEQLITSVVRTFFRRATDQVEARLAAESAPIVQIGTYLEAISEALAPASSAFYADLNDFAPAREIYLHNTAIATQRVQDLVTAATGPGHAVDARFIGAAAGAVMESIQRGEIEAITSLNDATAYRLLAELIVAGVAGRVETT